MAIAVAVVLLASATAFFVGFLFALCNDNKQPTAIDHQRVEVVRLTQNNEATAGIRFRRRSA